MAKFYSSDVPEYKVDKEQFEFVQLKGDIADAAFQDKPIGFFKDAMLRFCRSKVSIVAFVGIVVILFMAIFMIGFSADNGSWNTRDIRFPLIL